MSKKSTKKNVKRAVKVARKYPKIVIAVAIILIVAIVGVSIYGLYRFDWNAGALLDYIQDVFNGSQGGSNSGTGSDVSTPSGSSPSGSTPSGTVIVEKNFPESGVITEGELQIHFFEFGNGDDGDCILIKYGDVDILVDGGSDTSCLSTICGYLDMWVTDDVIEYCIVTHADLDHIANFAGTTKENTSLFQLYEFRTIIDFPLTDKTTKAYDRYVQNRNAVIDADTVHYTALQCWNNSDGARRSYEIAEGVSINFLYNYFYENKSSDENNYSVCFTVMQEEKTFLFTGDLEKKGEEYLVQYNDLCEVEFFKAGHHGSATSSNDCLLSIIKPKICVATGIAGKTSQYNFPRQEFIDRISKYTELVYIPSYSVDGSSNAASLNGDIIISSTITTTTVYCKVSTTVLKDTEWFKNNRTMPSTWAA